MINSQNLIYTNILDLTLLEKRESPWECMNTLRA